MVSYLQDFYGIPGENTGLSAVGVSFDNPEASYYPGQTITGKISFTIETPNKIRGVRLRIKGFCETRWVDSVRVTEYDNNSSWRTYWCLNSAQASETCLEKTLYLLGSRFGRTIDLKAGTYIYPFTYDLPLNLPFSFHEFYGDVRYQAKASILRPWKYNFIASKEFKVLSNLDLNELPDVCKPAAVKFRKNSTVMGIGSLPMTITVSIPCTGYTPGDSVPVKVDISNQFGRAVEEVQIILQENFVFKACLATKKETFPKSNVICNPISGTVTSSYFVNLKIPDFCYPKLQHCKIMQLDYKLNVKVTISGQQTSGYLPITIGAKPLTNTTMSTPTNELISQPPRNEKTRLIPEEGASREESTGLRYT